MIQSNFLNVTFVDEEFNSLNIIVVLVLPSSLKWNIYLADLGEVGTIIMCYWFWSKIQSSIIKYPRSSLKTVLYFCSWQWAGEIM